MRAAGGRSLLLSGDGLFQKRRHRPIRSCHLAPVCSDGSGHTLLRHLEVPLRPAAQSGPDLQMTSQELARMVEQLQGDDVSCVPIQGLPPLKKTNTGPPPHLASQ